MGAPDLKSLASSKEQPDRHRRSGDSFESWARALEASGLNFDPRTRRWHLLADPAQQEKPLQLEALTLFFRRSRVLPEHLRYKIDLKRWGKTAQNAARETFGSKTRAELHTCYRDGHPDGLWLALEFTRPDSRETALGYTNLFEHRGFQSGFLALKLDCHATPAEIKFCITHVAGLGYLPSDIWQKITRFIRRSLGLSGVSKLNASTSNAESSNHKDSTNSSDFLEVRIPIAEFLRPSVIMGQATATSSLEFGPDFEKIRLVHDNTGDLVWEYRNSGQRHSQDDDPFQSQAPTTSHHSAMMTELARMLLKSESEIPIEISDESDKSENDSGIQILKLSLKTRVLLERGETAAALEVLSSMIRSLHLEWPSFESSSIAGTILSELLGDCWAAQKTTDNTDGTAPFIMAKSAWQRAAALRANGMRILRKIAVAARAHGQVRAEKNALLEIIRQEKRRKDLARAMVRLAQISSGPAETGSSDDSKNTMTSNQLVLDAAKLTTDDEPLNLACFQQMVENGNFSEAWQFGQNLLNNATSLKSPMTRAEVANTLGHIAASENRDDGAAIHWFRVSLADNPSQIHALTGIAAIGARRGDVRIETDALYELVQILWNDPSQKNHASHDHEIEITNHALRMFQININFDSPNGLDTPRALNLLENCFSDRRHQKAPQKDTLGWLRTLELISNRRDFFELRPITVKAFLTLVPGNKKSDEHAWSDQSSRLIARMASILLSPLNVEESKKILSAALASLDQRHNHGIEASPYAGLLPESDAMIQLLEVLSINREHNDWMSQHGPALFRFLAPERSARILIGALKYGRATDANWLEMAVEQTLSNFPPLDFSADSTEQPGMVGMVGMGEFARLVMAAVEDKFQRNSLSGTTQLLFASISGHPDIVPVLLDGFEAEGSMIRREFMLHALGDAIGKTILGSPETLTLNSALRTLILNFGSEFVSKVRDFSKLIVIRVLESACLEGQAQPINDIEIELIEQSGFLNVNETALRCLLHQATIHKNTARASELFKVCLDHAVLRINDEKLAIRVISCWLERLKPARSAKSGTLLGESNVATTIDQLSSELITLLREFAPNHAEVIADQLGSAGFAQPADIVVAIAGACRNGKIDVAKTHLRRALKAAPESASDLANRLFFAIEPSLAQMKSASTNRPIGKNGVTELLLDWFNDPEAGGKVPSTLARLAGIHLEDRLRARRIIEKVQLDRQSSNLGDDRHLWMPLYMLLVETGTKHEVDQHLDAIIPGLHGDPRLLADYPFTVESLEAERNIQPTANLISDMSREIPVDLADNSIPDLVLDQAIDPTVEPTLFSMPWDIPSSTPSFELESEIDADSDSDVDSDVDAEMAFDVDPIQLAPLELASELATELPVELATDLEPIPFELPVVESVIEEIPPPEPMPEPMPEPIQEPIVEQKTDLDPNPDFTSTTPAAPEIAATPANPTTPPNPMLGDEWDWRSAVRNRKLGQGSTIKILNAAMPNKLEKHLALQAVAVMGGEVQLLDKWDWRVWRKPHEYAYSRLGKDRFPAGLSPRVMKTPAFKLLLRASPFLALSFPERFTMKGLAKSMGLSPRQLEAKRQRLDWATGFPGFAGFSYHAKIFSQRGLKLFSLQGLGPQIFYDAAGSCIYLDDSYFVRKPPTHLYHRVMFLLYSLRTQFHPLLNLNPQNQILPELNKVRAVIERGPLAIFAAQAKLSDSKMAKVMKPQDFEEFKLLFNRAGSFDADDISDACKSMQQYVWRLLLADSLDLTGIIEAMLDVDLMLPGTVKPGEVLLMSPQVDPLINFALALNLETTAP